MKYVGCEKTLLAATPYWAALVFPACTPWWAWGRL